MIFEIVRLSKVSQGRQYNQCYLVAFSKCFYSQKLETKYTKDQKQKILKIVNDCDENSLSQYNLAKGRLKKFAKWKSNNGQIKTLSDLELIEGFTEKTATKFFDSIIDEDNAKVDNGSKYRIKGQFLYPNLTPNTLQSCKTVLAVYTTVNSVCWSMIDRENYQLLDWRYYLTDHQEGKRMQITDILNIAWDVTQQLPESDIYVMKAEPTTLRAAGSDPNNPKILSVNLQKSQLVAMIVALINSRSNLNISDENNLSGSQGNLSQKVYFLRSTLPFRLFGTLIGNERVSSDQTIEMLLSKYSKISENNSHVYIPEDIVSRYKSQKDLERDMLGRCLFLALTFMDICIYNNQESINKLVCPRE